MLPVNADMGLIMRPDLQTSFIDLVTPERHERFVQDLSRSLGTQIEYRVCEMPIFVSSAFRRAMEDAAVQIILECCTPEILSRTDAALDQRYTVPHEDKRPLFSVVDFAVTHNADGTFVPRLIELQGFPSLFGYQWQYAKRIRDEYQLADTSPFFSNLDEVRYVSLLKDSIFAGHDPEEVALVEIDPEHQKTRTDFYALRDEIGIPMVNIRDLIVRNGNVFTQRDGREVQIKRIFNRAIVDELEDLGVTMPFRWSDDLNVEWAGHPNWYFRISKFIMPFLKHASVPRTVFLDQVHEIPEDLGGFVLKPLYAFAGKGVNVHPTADDIEAIPVADRSAWILQEKIVYDPCITTPYGSNKVELRVMLVWLPQQKMPLPVMSLARTGRGDLMGARYNTDPWTGSSGCLFCTD
jgi:hypothetical protein